MKKILKELSFWSISLVCILIILFSFNVIKSDFRLVKSKIKTIIIINIIIFFIIILYEYKNVFRNKYNSNFYNIYFKL